MLNPPLLREVPAAEVDEAFVHLFEHQRDRVFSIALRLTGRRSDAEDLAADTFLQAYRSMAGFDVERLDSLQPRAWLSTIVVNQWRNHCRTASRRPRVSVPDGDHAPDPVDRRADVDQQVLNREDGRHLAGLLLGLPERQRVALVLRFVADLPVAEVAEVMACPPGTVKSLVSRGLARLRAPLVVGGAGPTTQRQGALR